ncbi:MULTISPECIES: lipid-A-disaccharide synthase [unclassified Hyphomonas]|uniref:lipid-A-disaccharide synthase n=1 Tax=unclassified Hyphomonas TaxID=2630699 RepID=UPI000AE6247D|nr:MULTISPECIES: lipid-A-disaccharide synthase [unclassified Hyphomonas]
MKPLRIFMVAGEASGDLLAREVVEEIRRKTYDVELAGIGGRELASVGIHSPFDISPLSILGFAEGIRAYGTVVKLADAAADAIIAFQPDVVVLVDSWGFMLRVAQRVRARAPDIKLIKLIGPQVWATRPGRAKTLSATVDHLLCMHDMEAPYYEPFGLPTTVIGNPALSRNTPGDGQKFRAARGLGKDEKICLVLPGSRRSELAKVAPALLEAAKQVAAAVPGVRIIVSPAANMAEAFDEAFPDVSGWAEVLRTPEERYDAMAAADLALACSGTVTSELAMQGTPMIVAYRTGWLTWALARGLLYKKQHITLLNIVSDDQEIVPEFVQTRQKPELIADTAIKWLKYPELLDTQRQAQKEALARMQGGGHSSAEIAADAILSVARRRAVIPQE